MPYIVTKQSPRYEQTLLWSDLMNDLDSIDTPKSSRQNNFANTRTYFTYNVWFDGMYSIISRYIDRLRTFNENHTDLFVEDKATLYHTFYIPKHSGGLRRIDAPEPALMAALRELRTIFETEFNALYHTSAFAYVKGRCTIDAIKKHQHNESRWFLKTDFANFFGSTTPAFVMAMFEQVWPFSSIVQRSAGREELTKALSLCFLDGGLPQGTPISPLITNVMMIPFDHIVCNSLHDFSSDGKTYNMVYTRYADDILISCKVDFNKDAVVAYLSSVLATMNAPFTIKNEKTRYGSSAGRNWNLGVMLNNENKITIGYKKKKQFKAMLASYIRDKENNIPWELHDVQTLMGLAAYYTMVERDNIEYIFSTYNEKFKVDIMQMLKNDLQ